MVKTYVQAVCKQIAELEGKVFKINGLHVTFRFQELPNDMKMLAMLAKHFQMCQETAVLYML